MLQVEVLKYICQNVYACPGARGMEPLHREHDVPAAARPDAGGEVRIEGEIPLTVILVAIIFIGQQVYEGLFVQDNISNMGHILGGIVGALAGYTLNKKG